MLSPFSSTTGIQFQNYVTIAIETPALSLPFNYFLILFSTFTLVSTSSPFLAAEWSVKRYFTKLTIVDFFRFFFAFSSLMHLAQIH